MESINKPGRGRPRKIESNVIGSENNFKDEFEPIIIRFDDVSFNAEIEDQNETLYIFNEVINELKNVYELQLTDEEIEKHIIKRESLNDFVSKLFKNDYKIKRMIEIAQNEVLSVLEDFKERVKYKYHSAGNFKVKDGKISLKNDFVEKLRRKHTVSLDTPRAKKIYDLHQKAHALVIEIREMAREKGVSVEIGTLFEYDREYNIKARELRYNIL